MTDYFCTQDGAGQRNGAFDNPWSVADMSGSWTTLGFDGQPGNTVCLLDEITSTFTSGYNSDNAIIRGDHPGRECKISVDSGYGIAANRPGVMIKNITITSQNTFAINIAGTACGVSITSCEFDNCLVSVLVNAASNCFIEGNVIKNIPDCRGAYGIRLINSANNNTIQNNRLSGNKQNTSFGTLINIDGSDGNTFNLNTLSNQNGDGIYLLRSRLNTIEGNNVLGGIKDSIALEDSFDNVIESNYVYQDGYHGDTFPALKLGDNFGNGSPSDRNVINENIFVVDSDKAQVCLSGYPAGNNNNIDSNHYWNTIGEGAKVILWDADSIKGAYTLDQWKQETNYKYETNGIQSDPIWKIISRLH